MPDDTVPTTADLVAAIDALPDEAKRAVARHVDALAEPAVELPAAAEVAAIYDALDDDGKVRVAQLLTAQVGRVERRAQRQAEVAERRAEVEQRRAQLSRGGGRPDEPGRPGRP